MLDKIRNFIFGKKFEKLEKINKTLQKDNQAKRFVECDKLDCFDNDGKGTCDNTYIFLNEDGQCKECFYKFVDMKDDLQDEINIVPKFIVTEG